MLNNLHGKIKESASLLNRGEDWEDITFFVEPVPKPRMTRSDKWKKRPVVTHYFAFCDLLRLYANKYKFKVPAAGAHVVFHIPMPKSWSERKRAQMEGQPHQQKPDVDNLVKALLDALCEDDSYVWDMRKTKLWSNTGKIEIKKIPV